MPGRSRRGSCRAFAAERARSGGPCPLSPSGPSRSSASVPTQVDSRHGATKWTRIMPSFCHLACPIGRTVPTCTDAGPGHQTVLAPSELEAQPLQRRQELRRRQVEPRGPAAPGTGPGRRGNDRTARAIDSGVGMHTVAPPSSSSCIRFSRPWPGTTSRSTIPRPSVRASRQVSPELVTTTSLAAMSVGNPIGVAERDHAGRSPEPALAACVVHRCVGPRHGQHPESPRPPARRRPRPAARVPTPPT